jgi:hypothetical protein
MAMMHEEDFHIPKRGLLGDNVARSVRAFKNPSLVDAVVGVIVTLLAILGLAGAAPRTMAALAFIGVGIAFVADAAGISRRSQGLVPSQSPRTEITASVLAELMTGATGLVLGILALVGFGSYATLALASILFGVALLFGTGAAVQVDTVAAHLEPSQTRRVIHEAVVGASGARLLLAVGTVILGLLALFGVESRTLLLTAGLSLGVGLLLGAVSLGDRMPSSASFSAPGARTFSNFQSPVVEVPPRAPRGFRSTRQGLGD